MNALHEKLEKVIMPTWNEFDRLLIQATLDFANMGLGLSSKYEVEALFIPFIEDALIFARPEKKQKKAINNVYRKREANKRLGSTLLTGKSIQSRTISTYKSYQNHIRFLLDCIIKGEPLDEMDSINFHLKSIPFQLQFYKNNLIYKFSIKTVSEGAGLGLVILYESNYVLKQCEYCSCYLAVFNRQKLRQLYCTDCGKDVAREKASESQKRCREKKKER